MESGNTHIENFLCAECNYSTTDRSNYHRHLKSIKHINCIFKDRILLIISLQQYSI